jgi:hypothetical protein
MTPGPRCVNRLCLLGAKKDTLHSRKKIDYPIDDGDAEGVAVLLHNIARRERIGGVLAEGIVYASKARVGRRILPSPGMRETPEMGVFQQPAREY